MGSDFQLIWAVLLLPVAGFLLLALFGKRLEAALGRRAVGFVAVLPLALSFLIGVMLTLRLAALPETGRSIVVSGPDWISLLTLRIPFEWVVDPLSMTMVLIVAGIGSLIFLYSTGYMAEDREYARFFTYLNLFAGAMLVLVLGNNLPLLFVGWEGVGLCSYLLIGFWYRDVDNARAANKAFIVNRVGDWGLTLGIFLIFALLAGNRTAIGDGRFLSYDQMLPALQRLLLGNPGMATAIGLLLFVGAAGKSAQFPLYLWLPDAMAGPTPVSALIHAATMVTSGVVLLNRMHVVFEQSSIASVVVCGIGAFTALFAAIIAFGQTDIKKVLAYSTVSQLGFMFIGCGAGAYWAGMFHVTTHAFFKALLFLGAGAVIHAMSHNQDMRNYGNLKKYLPITTWTMVAGWLAISAVAIPGVFGFSGYYSKEALIGAALGNENASVNGLNVSAVAGWIGLGTALLTAWYMTRLTWLTFFSGQERWRELPSHADAHHAESAHAVEDLGPDPHGFYLLEPAAAAEDHAHELEPGHTPKEVPVSMAAPLVVLAVLSVFGGWLLARNGAFEHWLAPSSASITSQVTTEYPNLGIISLAAALLGIAAGLLVYRKGLPKSEGWNEKAWSPLRLAARDQFGFDRGATVATVDGGADLGTFLWRDVDDGLVDRFVNTVAGLAGRIGEIYSRAQRGMVRSYALLMLLGGIFIFGYFAYALSISSHLGGGR